MSKCALCASVLLYSRDQCTVALGRCWCGVVWCGVVWCGVVWCGVVWCGVVWCGVVWCGVVWCGVVWCGPQNSLQVLQEKLDTKRSKLAAVLKFYNVPWSLQKQVFTIYPHVLEASMHDMQEVSELPNYLQDQLYTHIKKNLLNSVPLLQDAGPQCVATIASHMPRVFAPPFKYLIKEGEVGECMFFLVRGIVEVLVKDDNGVDQLHCTLKVWTRCCCRLNYFLLLLSIRTCTQPVTLAATEPAAAPGIPLHVHIPQLQPQASAAAAANHDRHTIFNKQQQ